MKKVSILGFGQIGGSLGLALRAEGYEVTAVDLDPQVLQLGLSLGAASRITLDPLEGLQGAEMVILAAPVGANPTLLRAIAPYVQPGTIVTDVGSTKSAIVDLANELLPENVNFIGGHPMAGTEQAGLMGAKAELFVDALYVLTPGRICSSLALEQVCALVRCVGAIPVIMEAQRHDKAVSVVSHLPHLLAVALAQTAGELENTQPGSLALAAGSFQDGTRVADSSPRMWQDICLANREQILHTLELFKGQLAKLEGAVLDRDSASIEAGFKQASQVRSRLKQQRKRERLIELVVGIANEPGALGQLTQALGGANLNISKVETLSGEKPGVILGFEHEPAAEAAREVISTLGIQVWGRE